MNRRPAGLKIGEWTRRQRPRPQSRSSEAFPTTPTTPKKPSALPTFCSNQSTGGTRAPKKRGGWSGAALVACVLVAGCKRPAAAVASASPIDAESPKSAPVTAPGCALSSQATMALSEEGDDLEFGGVVAVPDGVALGFQRNRRGQETNAVAFVNGEGTKATIVELGVARPNSPAPKPLYLNGAPYAVAYARRGKEENREPALSVFRVAEGESTPIARVPVSTPKSSTENPAENAISAEALLEASLDSPGFDVAAGSSRALLAWSQSVSAARATPRGVIKVAVFDGSHLLPATVASPEASDADSPELATRPGGYLLAWIAHRPEPSKDRGGGSRPELEGPPEAREYRWVEVAWLDDAGKPLGEPLRLTSPSGHVASFTFGKSLASASGTPRDIYDLIVHDSEEAHAGGGGRIFHVRLNLAGTNPAGLNPAGDAVGPAELLVAEGVGRGVPVWVGARGAPSWLAFEDVSDRASLLSLTDNVVPRGAPIPEPLLEDTELLVPVKGGILALRRDGPASRLRVVSCSP